MTSPKISLDEVLKVARLARVTLSEDEASALAHDLDAILGYVALLDKVDTSAVEPMSHAISRASALRDDRVLPGVDREEALAAAPRARDGGFSVPKVLEVDP